MKTTPMTAQIHAYYNVITPEWLRWGVADAYSGTVALSTINAWLIFHLQYKMLWVDYETGTANTLDYFNYDTVMYGSILGLNFEF